MKAGGNTLRSLRVMLCNKAAGREEGGKKKKRDTGVSRLPAVRARQPTAVPLMLDGGKLALQDDVSKGSPLGGSGKGRAVQKRGAERRCWGGHMKGLETLDIKARRICQMKDGKKGDRGVSGLSYPSKGGKRREKRSLKAGKKIHGTVSDGRLNSR